MAQRTREHRCVDPAGRGAGEDVDDDAQLYLVADLLQEFKIVGLGIVFRVTRVGLVEEPGLGSTRTVGDPVQGARGTHKLQDLLADAVHIHRERNAAEADECDSEFLFAQEQPPRREYLSEHWSGLIVPFCRCEPYASSSNLNSHSSPAVAGSSPSRNLTS